MDYCLASSVDHPPGVEIHSAELDVDLDGDGLLDAVGIDLDGDGLVDDALTDLDGDGLADEGWLDRRGPGHDGVRRTDDGTGTWSLGADAATRLRWFTLDGAESAAGTHADLDGDGVAEGLSDADGDGLADLALGRVGDTVTGWLDVDGDGRWDTSLRDADGDGRAERAAALG